MHKSASLVPQNDIYSMILTMDVLINWIRIYVIHILWWGLYSLLQYHTYNMPQFTPLLKRAWYFWYWKFIQILIIGNALYEIYVSVDW